MITAVHLQVVFYCALALCAAYFAAKFLAKYFDFSQGGPGPNGGFIHDEYVTGRWYRNRFHSFDDDNA